MSYNQTNDRFIADWLVEADEMKRKIDRIRNGPKRRALKALFDIVYGREQETPVS